MEGMIYGREELILDYTDILVNARPGQIKAVLKTMLQDFERIQNRSVKENENGKA